MTYASRVSHVTEKGYISYLGFYEFRRQLEYIAILNHLRISYSLPLLRRGLGWGKKFTTPARIAISARCMGRQEC